MVVADDVGEDALVASAGVEDAGVVGASEYAGDSSGAWATGC